MNSRPNQINGLRILIMDFLNMKLAELSRKSIKWERESQTDQEESTLSEAVEEFVI